MADSKGPEAKPNETKSGPVKPPVLDLKARDATSAKPENKPATKPVPPAAKPTVKAPEQGPPKPADIGATAGTGAKATAPKPAAPAESGFPIGATLAGGVLGLVAAYGLAFLGFWPTPPAPTAQPDPRIAQLAGSVPELETVTQTTQAELATLTQRVGALEGEAGGTASTPLDLGPIESEIAALSDRIDALPAGGDDSADLASVRTELGTLAGRLDEMGARLGTAEAGLRTLDSSVSATSAALANQPGDIGAVLQLPLVLSGFESAFATGRPYEAELATLHSAAPDTAVPPAIVNQAATGLPRPDLVAQRFGTVLPAMLAGRPANPDAQWQDGALDWVRSAIALRPTGEMEGDTPEAIMSRLEAAVNRRDFAAADALLKSLPAPMQAAAGDVAAQIASHAEAATFLADVRASALSGEAAQ